ncbi:MAG: hypothetical protein WAX89_02845 [Alphaproteobacteria bacterium]
MQRLTTAAVILAELSHVFCCGIPILAAALSMWTQLGMGAGFLAFHDAMHAYEVPVLIFSGCMIALSALLQFASHKVHCQTACHHGDCTPKKFQASKMFWVALALYGANLAVYFMHLSWAEEHDHMHAEEVHDHDEHAHDHDNAHHHEH